MARGRKTGGRRLGTPNKKTAEMKEAGRRLLEDTDQALRERGLKLFAGDAHALLTLIYKHPEASMEMRMSAAATAIRYETAAKSAMDLNVTARRADQLTDDQLAEFIQAHDAKALPAPSNEPIDLDCTENPQQKSE